MSTDAPQPFRRQVQWSSLPKPVFRAGPLPSGGTLPPLPELPKPLPPQAAATRPVAPRPAGGGILNGSLIPQAPRPRPQAQPAAPVPAVSRAQPPVLPAEEKPERAPVPPPSMPDMTVRALPEPDAAEAAAPEAPQPIRPVSAAASEKSRRTSRLPLMVGAGLAASVAVVAGVWTLTRSEDATSTTAPVEAGVEAPAPPAPVRADAVAERQAPVAETTVPMEAASQPVREAPAVASVQPARRTTPAPVPSEAAPPPVVAAPQIDTAPLIEPAPIPAGPAPTTAERPTSDPDAPVLTRPQPLD